MNEDRDVLELIYKRWQEGSLLLDSAEDHGPDDPEPIQFVIARALGRKP